MKYGSTQVVAVDSNPKGAKVNFQPGGQEITTPSKVVLSRRSSYIAHFEKEGYEPKSVSLESSASSSLWRNAIWIHPIGWIIGVVVDLSTGAGKDITPENVNVDLIPLAFASTPTGDPKENDDSANAP